MKYLEFMAKKRLFTLENIVKIAGNINTAKSIAGNYEKKNIIERIKQNYYAFLDLATKDPVANKFEIASNIKCDGYLSYHSAFEYYGFYNQVFNEVTISSQKKFNDFLYRGLLYKSDVSNCNKQIEKINGGQIKVTSIERTIIDSLYNMNKAGGLEEVLNCIELVTKVNENKLLEMLNEYDQVFLYQKAGFILEWYNDNLHLSKKFFDKCKSKLTNKIQYLYNVKMPCVYNKEWKLYVPIVFFDTYLYE